MEIVEYLISVCQADLEQRGQYEVSDDRYKYNTEQLSVSPSIRLSAYLHSSYLFNIYNILAIYIFIYVSLYNDMLMYIYRI